MHVDPKGIPMYYKKKGGKEGTCRGTSQDETYHRHWHHSARASNYSVPMFLARRQDFNHRWNTRMGIANEGEVDWGTTNYMTLERIKVLSTSTDPAPSLEPVTEDELQATRQKLPTLPPEVSQAISRLQEGVTGEEDEPDQAADVAEGMSTYLVHHVLHA
jgi:hypothetical protein